MLREPALPATVGDESGKILHFLRGERERGRGGGEPDGYEDAVAYAIGRYERGLSHYVAALERIGFAEKGEALDVGSGAGHWCFAFLKRGRRAVGIDRSPAFVELAARIAREIGLADRVSFRTERAEEAQLPAGAFDCAWAHSVLMYTDQETVLRNVADALAKGGGFYCGYTGEGSRLHTLQVNLAGETELLSSRLKTFLDAHLHRCGVLKPGNLTRMLRLEDLLRACAVFGMEYVGRPQVQDGRPEYLGLPATFDFVVRKLRDRDKAKSQLLRGEAIERTWLEDLDRIARSGCPGLVCDVCRAVDPDPAEEEERRQVYARALILAGRADSEERWRIFEDAACPLPDHIMGLYWHARGDHAAALGAYRNMPSEHPDRAFLQGACLLQMKRFGWARRVFSEAIERGCGAPREWIGLVAAHHFSDKRDAAAAAFKGFV